MKINKRFIVELLILVVPVAGMLLLMPVLPERIPIQWKFNIEAKRFIASRFIDREFSFLLGILPFVLYQLFKFKYSKR